ncbi:hypothetical protein [Burkholderia vietnamiensis]|uniref:hypothetical protein n=1 Tax=Burkholderia vietnamiensis TaxID=60552 RepID=UPI0015946AA4|nr:hypothetical protein [Burkholderia vietnamiensis]MCA8270364.1 hypothetical protein [Burkholderia vietnamiensis]
MSKFERALLRGAVQSPDDAETLGAFEDDAISADGAPEELQQPAVTTKEALTGHIIPTTDQ